LPIEIRFDDLPHLPVSRRKSETLSAIRQQLTKAHSALFILRITEGRLTE
jgi:hypothetical protein